MADLFDSPSASDPNDLTAARYRFNRDLREGTICPCCKRPAMIRPRNLNSAMAYALILLHKKNTTEFVHYQDVIANLPSRDFGTLVHWGLVEARGDVKDDGNPSSGYYRITEAGKQFVLGKLMVKKYVYIFNRKSVDVDEPKAKEMIDIQTALNNKFNYRELMEGC